MKEKVIVPIQEEMWRERDGEVYLIGSICKQCGEIYFPKKDLSVCAYCGSENIEEKEIKGYGEIYNYVQIDYPPAGGFYFGPAPFICAVVRMEDNILVEGHLVHTDTEDVKIGDKVRVIVDELMENDKEIIMSYMFEPVRQDRR